MNLSRITVLLLIFILTLIENIDAQNVAIRYENGNVCAEYAVKKLSESLEKSGYKVSADNTDSDYFIRLSKNVKALGSEAFNIEPDGNLVEIFGGDDRGLIYGALELAESIENGISLAKVKPVNESPYLEFRGIKFNVPWETYRPSSALDQHLETAKDLKYWEAFLDMMVRNRFNVISLWNMHPYTFMIKPTNFPLASPWTDEEFEEWQHLYHEIFRMAKERALDTYIVHWNIFVSEAFAENYNTSKVSFYPHYYVPGDTSKLVKKYLRESIKQVLEEYPDLDGVGISHGEGMADMTPLQRQQWVDEVLIAGMLDADRRVKLIHRVPFSSGTSSEPGVSKNVEVVTREAMEKLEDQFEGPIWVEIKFNWSHAHSTPKLEKVHGGELGDTYFNPLPKNYKIVWQARNEDFFALRWGVPDFIRQHIALNGTNDYVGGYFTGSETYIPALDYFTALDEPVDWKWAFERQWLYYKLWGRLLYNPQTPNEVFQAEFTWRFGKQAKNMLKAYELASSTQLRLASLYDSRWDFTLYSEGFLALQGDTTKYISVDQLIQQPTMASNYVSVGDYVKTKLDGGSFDKDKITPPKLVDMLEKDNKQAIKLVNKIDVTGNASLMYEVADVKIWANLGLHLAEKIKGAMALETYRLAGDEEHREMAVEHLQNALAYWDEVIKISRPIYKDMKLTHYNHNFFDANDNNLFHWALIRNEVAKDIEIARKSKSN
ncbi:MAG: hypothetical protein JXR61_05615 [Prolixibacteraceae bacterium]|nr:hypothetical protein [Prolixibacteraceae bacterium]